MNDNTRDFGIVAVLALTALALVLTGHEDSAWIPVVAGIWWFLIFRD